MTPDSAFWHASTHTPIPPEPPLGAAADRAWLGVMASSMCRICHTPLTQGSLVDQLFGEHSACVLHRHV